jgi:S1-C subfamily serine protease
VLFFFTGTHADYHQLGDHADKIAFARMAKIVRLAYGVLDQVVSGKTTPSYIHHISWLGAAIQVKDQNGRKNAVITGVDADSRGKRAGLAVGDVIRSIDGKPLTRPKKIGDRFGALEPGKKAAVTLERGGKTVEVTVERAKRGYLGVMPTPLRSEERKKLGLVNDEGVRIRGLADSGPAGKAGIRAGDVLIRINGHPLSWRTLGRHLARIGAGERVVLTVVRAGKRLKIPLTLAERPRRPQ